MSGKCLITKDISRKLYVHSLCLLSPRRARVDAKTAAVVLITFDLEVHPRQIRIEDLSNVKKPVKQIIAFRKACKASGTGLSHYILMETKPKK